MLKRMFSGMKSQLIFAFLLVPIFSLSADQIILDQKLSPGVSSTNFIFLENRLLELQNYYKDEKHNSFIKTGAGADLFNSSNYYLNGPYYFSESFDYRLLKASFRAAEMGLIWAPLSYITTVVQHEVFGHGYRVRDLGSKKAWLNKYNIQFKLTRFGVRLKEASTQYFLDLTTFNDSDRLLTAIGGMEANSILAHNLIMSWLNSGQIDGRQSLLWQYAYKDQINYIMSLNRIKNPEAALESGHDILNYIVKLNEIYPFAEPLKQQLVHLQNRAIASTFLNPFTYLSFYSACSYILFNSAVSIPSIPLSGMHFLPAYRLGLTPFGPEDIFEMFYWMEGFSPICVYWKHGEFSLNDYIGFGFECQKVALSKIGDFGLKLDLWRQPHMLNRVSSYQGPVKHSGLGYEYYIEDFYRGYSHQELFGQHLGGALSLFYLKALESDPNTNMWLQLGYKTKGFLPGETYKQAPIIKVGMQTQF